MHDSRATRWTGLSAGSVYMPGVYIWLGYIYAWGICMAGLYNMYGWGIYMPGVYTLPEKSPATRARFFAILIIKMSWSFNFGGQIISTLTVWWEKNIRLNRTHSTEHFNI
jgi:hypothetical protein